jgi:5-methylcytosine-specific restriction endonuclease McrA
MHYKKCLYIVCDHIIPIALGGAKLDPITLNTLYVKCLKEKTKEDIKKLTEIRREEKDA